MQLQLFGAVLRGADEPTVHLMDNSTARRGKCALMRNIKKCHFQLEFNRKNNIRFPYGSAAASHNNLLFIPFLFSLF